MFKVSVSFRFRVCVRVSVSDNFRVRFMANLVLTLGLELISY